VANHSPSGSPYAPLSRGEAESNRVDEVEALREELARVAWVAHKAIRDLQALKSNTSAAKHSMSCSILTPNGFNMASATRTRTSPPTPLPLPVERRMHLSTRNTRPVAAIRAW